MVCALLKARIEPLDDIWSILAGEVREIATRLLLSLHRVGENDRLVS